ncbi:MAG: hypothetical protein K0R63_1029 [Rickettsiales bacterium]|jgi:mRNA interferase MazF|nr:hypothetical protein [Rickettsiales bacterium]
MLKDFDRWTIIKKQSHHEELRLLFKERDVWWCRLGANVGDEQDGKGGMFTRPVLIIRKFNKRVFIGLPFSSVIKEERPFYHKFTFKGKEQSVILSQIRLLDAKRLSHKLGVVSEDDFEEIKRKAQSLIFRM